MCGICGKGVNTYLCKKCEIRLKSLSIFGNESIQGKYFENHLYLFKYDGIVRNLIIDYKFNEKPYLYRSFIKFLEIYQKECLHFDFYDIIVPVPLSKMRLKKRGYNQSALIARDIAKILKVKFENNVLIKQNNIIAQSTLNKSQREENVKDAYKIKNKTKFQNKKILLIDDIYTTGSTVNECAKILKNSGAKKIDIFTIAKD